MSSSRSVESSKPRTNNSVSASKKKRRPSHAVADTYYSPQSSRHTTSINPRKSSTSNSHNAHGSAVTDFKWRPGREYRKTSAGQNPFGSNNHRVTTAGDKDKSDSKKTSGGYKYDATRNGGNNGWDEKFRKLGIASSDRNGNWMKNVLLAAASGVQERVGYAIPRGYSEYGISLLRSLRKNGVKSLAQALSKFSFRNIMRGLWQKPLYQRADKVGDKDFSNSVFNMSTKNKNNKDVKNFFLGAAGNDGGNINFRGEVSRVLGALKSKFGGSNLGFHQVPSSGHMNDRRLFRSLKAKLNKVADYARKHKDKAINLAFFASGHGNYDHNGKRGLQGSTTSHVQGFHEKALKNLFARTFKGIKNVGINIMVAACHSGGFVA